MSTRVGFATIADLPIVKVDGIPLDVHVFIQAQRRQYVQPANGRVIACCEKCKEEARSSLIKNAQTCSVHAMCKFCTFWCRKNISKDVLDDELQIDLYPLVFMREKNIFKKETNRDDNQLQLNVDENIIDCYSDVHAPVRDGFPSVSTSRT